MLVRLCLGHLSNKVTFSRCFNYKRDKRWVVMGVYRLSNAVLHVCKSSNKRSWWSFKFLWNNCYFYASIPVLIIQHVLPFQGAILNHTIIPNNLWSRFCLMHPLSQILDKVHQLRHVMRLRKEMKSFNNTWRIQWMYLYNTDFDGSPLVLRYKR